VKKAYFAPNKNNGLSTQQAMTYTKRDLVRRISERMDIPMVQAEPWVDAVIESLRETLMEANPTCRIEIRDFGVFEVKMTKAKPKARNPKTNEVIYVPEHRKTHFKPSKLLKEFLRQPLSDIVETK
jgi:integration host factor subunit beta